MPQQASGSWPANVSAVIITKEEKEAQLATAPPGGQPVVQSVPQQHPYGAPYADVQTRIIPNVLTTPTQPTTNQEGASMTEQKNQNAESSIDTNIDTNDAELFFGGHALILAKNIGIPFVWTTENRKAIDLSSAEKLIAESGPRSVCFDFKALEKVSDDELDNMGESDDPYMAVPTPPNASQPAVASQPTVASQPAVELPNNIQSPPGFPTQNVETVVHGRQHVDPITDRERLAFGNVLTTPGQTVYMRPNVIRVEVEGNVRVQKGRKGDVRMMRITRLEPVQSEAQLANAMRTEVQPPNISSPNPAVIYRQSQPATDHVNVPRPKVPVPNVNTNTSETADHLEEFDF